MPRIAEATESVQPREEEAEGKHRDSVQLLTRGAKGVVLTLVGDSDCTKENGMKPHQIEYQEKVLPQRVVRSWIWLLRAMAMAFKKRLDNTLRQF